MTSAEEQFTLQQLISLTELARERFAFVPFTEIPWDSSFVLWRHDVDISLNRAYRCANEEHKIGVLATYFINPSSSLYNPFEAPQAQLVREIAAMGHRIGLHFDANGVDPCEIDAAMRSQRQSLEAILGVTVEAVSFHNPKAEHLANNSDTYGDGLINAYARTLMQDVTYASDSNGYWRHRPLREVLNDASVTRLQVLTHPGWWQDIEMPPRSRIFRSVYGRASNVMSDYDRTLLTDGRENRSGDLHPFVDRLATGEGRDDSTQQAVVDFLWHAEAFVALYGYLSEMLTGLKSQSHGLDALVVGPTTGEARNRVEGSHPDATDAASLHSRTFTELAAMSQNDVRNACIEFMSVIARIRDQSSYQNSPCERTMRSTE